MNLKTFFGKNNKKNIVTSVVLSLFFVIFGTTIVGATSNNLSNNFEKDFSEFVTFKVNENSSGTTTGLVPLKADFSIEIDWNRLLPEIIREQYNREVQDFDADLNSVAGNATIVLSFGDADILNNKQCGYLPPEGQDVLCNQPLEKVEFSVFSGNGLVDDSYQGSRFDENNPPTPQELRNIGWQALSRNNLENGIQAINFSHTYLFERDFNVELKIKYRPVFLSIIIGQGHKADYLLGRHIIKAKYPKPSASVNPAVATKDTERVLSISCAPGTEFFAIKTLSGDTNSTFLGLLKDKNLFKKFKFMKGLWVFQESGVQQIDVPILPNKDTTYQIRCIPDGALNFKAKYNKYQKYITFPEKTYAETTVTARISTDACEPARICVNNTVVDISDQCISTEVEVCEDGCLNGRCLDVPEQCEVVTSCYSDQVIQTQNQNCSNSYSACGNGTICSNGACVIDDGDVNNCSLPSGLYCYSGDVYTTFTNDCRRQLVESCTYGCYAGACNQSANMEILSDLKATPSLLRKSQTTRISWEVANADSCTVLGGLDSWSGAAGDYQSSPIEQETTYTLTCQGSYGDNIEQSVKVRIVPAWQEL